MHPIILQKKTFSKINKKMSASVGMRLYSLNLAFEAYAGRGYFHGFLYKNNPSSLLESERYGLDSVLSH